MDDNSRRRRPNDAAPMHGASTTRYPQGLHDPSQQQQQRRSLAGSSSYRPAPISTSPSSGARGLGSSANYNGYYSEAGAAANAFSPASAMPPQSTLGYHQSTTADYGQADAARPTQNFANAYNPTAMMYNVQGAGAQSPAVYDTSQQFSSRQPAALQMMPTDVTAPYFSNDANSATAAAAAAAAPVMQPRASSSASQTVYQQSGLSNFSTAGNMAALGGMSTTQQPAQSADVSMADQEYPSAGGLNEAYASYQSALKEILQNIRNGVLATASESLLNVSDWLLSHVAELGLTSDDHNLHGDRIKMWNDFNHAWLAMFQRQKDLMEAGQQRSPNLISQEGLEKMGKELVRLCDGIERYGLVDYHYGVWEEQIIAILEECLDLFSAEDSANAGSGSYHR